MSVLTNSHHEKFCQEIAKGIQQREAYRASGLGADSTDDVVDACAARLRASADVEQRVNELKERSARRAELSRADILEMLLADRLLARDSKQAAAAIRATELLGKETAGMFTDKKEIRTGSLDEIDVRDLERLRETLTAERARRADARGGEGIEPAEDRKVLPGPWPASAGVVSKAS